MTTGVPPTIGGFITFVQNVLQPPASFNPTTSPYVTYAYDFAIQFCNPFLQCVPGLQYAWTMYALAVYNLAADTLINFAQDQPGDPIFKENQTYWTWLRAQYGVFNFVAGVVQSTGDEGTNSSYQIPKQFENYTIANLQNLKTPYGRQYLAIAGSWGSLWGIS
jgi:hypothetical protein